VLFLRGDVEAVCFHAALRFVFWLSLATRSFEVKMRLYCVPCVGISLPVSY